MVIHCKYGRVCTSPPHSVTVCSPHSYARPPPPHPSSPPRPQQSQAYFTHCKYSRVCMSPPHSLTICAPHSYPLAPSTSPQPRSPATAITSSFSKSELVQASLFLVLFFFICSDICFISSGLYYCLGVEFPLSLVDKEPPGTDFQKHQ